MKVKRGEIYLTNLNDAYGSEQAKIRPVLVIQNNLGNKHSPTTIVACLSSKVNSKAHLPTHYLICYNKDLKYQSIVVLEQIKFIDKSRLIKKITKLDKRQMTRMILKSKQVLHFINMVCMCECIFKNIYNIIERRNVLCKKKDFYQQKKSEKSWGDQLHMHIDISAS